MSKKPYLHDVICCGKYLCSAPASTKVYCPSCNRWAMVEPKTKEKAQKVGAAL